MAKNYLTIKHGCFKERRNGNTNTLDTVDETLLVYSKSDMNSWKVKLWNDHLALEADRKSKEIMIGKGSTIDASALMDITHHKYLFPRSSKRTTDTKVMSLIHGHDLSIKSFRYSLKLTSSPLCDVCPSVKDNNHHKIFKCPKFNCKYRKSLLRFSESESVVHGILTSQPTQSTLTDFRSMAQIVIK